MLRAVTPAVSEPVDLASAKAQLGISAGDASKDDLIKLLISSATRGAEALVQRMFVKQTVELVLNRWEPVIRLPIAPVVSDGVVSITYVDWATQAATVLDEARYVVRTSGPTVELFPAFSAMWPLVFQYASEPIVIRFDVGTAVADVPANVKTAILMAVRHDYSLGEQSPFVGRDMVVGIGERALAVNPAAASLLPDNVQRLLLSEAWS
ncbi:MAG: hypothetical protein J0G28_14370 [Afipia sp.]|nr:hypothetical protein [Afipia sp.]OJW65484.1 MAG: hypothetical protein BGO65_12205 [Afipia sp. 64-13]